MRRTASLISIVFQLIIVGLFFMTVFNDDIKIEKYVSTVHNDNLNKIASSVSILFEEEEEEEKMIEDLTLKELPSIDKIEEKLEDAPVIKEEKNKSNPLTSVEASKYTNNSKLLSMGFKVTEGNKNYSLSDDEFNVVVAVVAMEYDNSNLNDALAVMSVILNRCESKDWKMLGSNPYYQVIADGQFEVFFTNKYDISYLRYMPTGDLYNSDKYKQKYEIAKQAVIDGLNGIRNNDYLSFRSGFWKKDNMPYSNNYIVSGGNRYAY